MNPRDQILSLLTARGETQKDLAEKLGIAPQALSRALNTPPDLRGIWRRLLDEFGLQITLTGESVASGAEQSPPSILLTAAEAAAQTLANIAATNDIHRVGITQAISKAMSHNSFTAYYPHLISEQLASDLNRLGYSLAEEPDQDDETAGETVIMWRPTALVDASES